MNSAMQIIAKSLMPISVVLLGVFLTACGSVPSKQGTAIDEIGAALSEGTTTQATSEAPPPQVSDALMPSIDIQVPQAGESDVSEPRFDVAANNVAAQDFFMSLVEALP